MLNTCKGCEDSCNILSAMECSIVMDKHEVLRLSILLKKRDKGKAFIHIPRSYFDRPRKLPHQESILSGIRISNKDVEFLHLILQDNNRPLACYLKELLLENLYTTDADLDAKSFLFYTDGSMTLDGDFANSMGAG